MNVRISITNIDEERAIVRLIFNFIDGLWLAISSDGKVKMGRTFHGKIATVLISIGDDASNAMILIGFWENSSESFFNFHFGRVVFCFF